MDKTFEEITKKLTDHFDPKPLIIVERYHFHKREQASGETLAEYVAELRRLATKCNFGTHLDEIALCVGSRMNKHREGYSQKRT